MLNQPRLSGLLKFGGPKCCSPCHPPVLRYNLRSGVLGWHGCQCGCNRNDRASGAVFDRWRSNLDGWQGNAWTQSATDGFNTAFRQSRCQDCVDAPGCTFGAFPKPRTARYCWQNCYTGLYVCANRFVSCMVLSSRASNTRSRVCSGRGDQSETSERAYAYLGWVLGSSAKESAELDTRSKFVPIHRTKQPAEPDDWRLA